MLARIHSGEYGRSAPSMLLESMGLAPHLQRAGIGRRMLEALEKRAASAGVRTVTTQVDWRRHGMLRFLASAGFSLAPRLLLSRPVARMPMPAIDAEIERPPAVVRNLREEDFARVVRVDQQLTGRDRSDYFRRKFDEALLESAMRISLVVEQDGFVVGHAMARVDMGDFGHIEPRAVLDTIGISPDCAGKGLAHDLLGQMIDNLAALHVEALETEVVYDHFELAQFLCGFGFVPSQRLIFEVERPARSV
jgi:GNAT superfamily N-acetyltransferase